MIILHVIQTLNKDKLIKGFNKLLHFIIREISLLKKYIKQTDYCTG